MTLLNRIPFPPSWDCLVLLLPCFFLWVKHCTYSCLLFIVRVGQSSHPVNNSLDPNSVIPHFCHLYPFWLRVIYTFDEQALYISSWGIEFKNKCLTGQGQGQNPWARKYKSLSTQALSHSSALIQQGICLLNCLCIQSKFLHHVYKTLKTLFLRHKTKVQKPYLPSSHVREKDYTSPMQNWSLSPGFISSASSLLSFHYASSSIPLAYQHST